jgi:hypothetical protein
MFTVRGFTTSTSPEFSLTATNLGTARLHPLMHQAKSISQHVALKY